MACRSTSLASQCVTPATKEQLPVIYTNAPVAHSLYPLGTQWLASTEEGTILWAIFDCVPHMGVFCDYKACILLVVLQLLSLATTSLPSGRLHSKHCEDSVKVATAYTRYIKKEQPHI